MRCYIVRASDGLAAAVVMYAVPLMILTLTRSAAWTGLAFLIEWIPRLVTIGGAGPLIDRYSATAAILGTSALRAAVAVVTLVALTAGAGATAILVFGVLVGMLADASFLASESLAAHASRRAGPRAHHVQSTMTGIDQSTLLLGPLFGGVLLLVSPALLLGVVAILSCLTTTAALVLRDAPRDRVEPDPVAEPAAPLAALAQGLGTVRRTPALAWLVGALAVANLVSGVLQVSAPITVTRQLDHSSAAVGTVWSLATAASLLAVAAARRAVDRHGLYRVALAGAVLMCAATVAAGLAHTLTAYAVSIAAMMAAEGALTVVLRTARARMIPATGSATALAVIVLLVLAPFPFAGLLVAAVPITAMSHLVLAVAAVQIAATALCFQGLWKHRGAYEHPATTQPTAA